MFDELYKTGRELVELARGLTLMGILKFIGIIILAIMTAPFISYLVVSGCILALLIMVAFIVVKTGQGVYKHYNKEEKMDG